MGISYKEKFIKTGQYAEVEIFPVVHHPRARSQKYRPTTEAQALINQAHAERKLTRLVNTNFTQYDYALHLTYADYKEPSNIKQAEADVRNFIDRLRRLYKKAEIELKYIYAVELDSHWHFHMIINKGISREAVEQCWGKGWANGRGLQFTENGILELSHYVQKQHLSYRRWTCSRNLKKPEETEKAIGKKYTQSLIDNWNVQSFVTERYPGYFLVLDQSDKVINSTNGFEYVRLFLCRTDANISFYSQRIPDEPELTDTSGTYFTDYEDIYIQERLW